MVQSADLLHELVVLVIKLDVSTFSTDLFLVGLFFSLLGLFFVFKNDESRSSSLAIEFLHEDGTLSDAITYKELDDFGCLDLVRQTSHDE